MCAVGLVLCLSHLRAVDDGGVYDKFPVYRALLGHALCGMTEAMGTCWACCGLRAVPVMLVCRVGDGGVYDEFPGDRSMLGGVLCGMLGALRTSWVCCGPDAMPGVSPSPVGVSGMFAKYPK